MEMTTNISFLPSLESAHMASSDRLFDEAAVLHELKHYLPAQAPLKDFIHHNTLHAFQDKKFHEAIRHASAKFGYKVSLTLVEYREAFHSGRISMEILEKCIVNAKGKKDSVHWIAQLLRGQFEAEPLPRIGSLRSNWKRVYKIDMDSMVHPTLFRILCSYLDQGIAIWNFPIANKGFLNAIREMEEVSYTSFFRTKMVSKLLTKGRVELDQLLRILVGDEGCYKQYLFDQQFAHQGWSGMVSAIEDQPSTLLARRKITLHDIILFELLLEIDVLYDHVGDDWKPLSECLEEKPADLFATVPPTEYSDVISMWQDAYEWSYYDQVLAGIVSQKNRKSTKVPTSFQAVFCIDDRECSFRRYIEAIDANCDTFGTPGFFGVAFFFQPQDGKHLTKLCPAPVTPKHLIKEIGVSIRRKKDPYFNKHAQSFHGGWLISQTLGFWSAFKLFLNIFRPTIGPASTSSFRHMDKSAKLTIEATHPEQLEEELQVGFTVLEMADRVEGVLKSIGLVKDFALIVYVVGHGSSSVNNPHYAAYDCGACSGRAGSVNARVFCFMANHSKVRELLEAREIHIPVTTQFIGGLHDTTRDDIEFFDEDTLTDKLAKMHRVNEKVFDEALDKNAKERSRRFQYVKTASNLKEVHKQVRKRSVSLFEPRPELNHATNALCVVGRRNLTEHLFLDRRAFMNSYDHEVDPDGKYLLNILNAVAPVCGGINLEYFFSRVDNQKLGAGTKLPHNVMGLFGVANGIDGDLRPGLPSQMIEVHDPVRLLVIVEHFTEIVDQSIRNKDATYEWFKNEWVNLVVVNPRTHELSVFRNEEFVPYKAISEIRYTDDLERIIETQMENLPVYTIS